MCMCVSGVCVCVSAQYDGHYGDDFESVCVSVIVYVYARESEGVRECDGVLVCWCVCV
jgi:hypothetical protein